MATRFANCCIYSHICDAKWASGRARIGGRAVGKRRSGDSYQVERERYVLTNWQLRALRECDKSQLEWGEQPRAIVVLKKGETATPEEIMEYCRVKLASFKRPRSVVFVDELPRNPMGKILKRVLREQYSKV